MKSQHFHSIESALRRSRLAPRWCAVRYGLWIFLLCIFGGSLQAQQPRLEVSEVSSQQIRLSWPSAAIGFALESASAVSGTGDVWTAVATPPQVQGDEVVILVPITGASQFFRLRQGGAQLTRIAESSPANGESGVAVTRETIIRFSAPLAASAVVTANQLYAEFAGRRILSRIHLSSDHRNLTLFYLEQLPASARVRVTLNGSGLKDERGVDVDVNGDGVPGGMAFIDFETLSITPVGQTAVIGRVFASELVIAGDGSSSSINRPLPGVTITVDGAEETLRTTTDALGNFKLQPAPAGRFFVNVDGRTAEGSHWPNGAYYPVVGKAWEAVAGRADNLAGGTGEIYLPLVRAGTLQPVSLTQDTPITFPAEVLQANPQLSGVAITVPAGSLFGNDGTAGGRVGIAPVPPDRLPEPLPPGLDFPLVITVQTDGPGNFDRPVPVRFPNLPDPVTGEKLPPGAKTALWSFNHDTGKWEIQGPMTVTADGNFVESDPGVGIRQPGWHGVRAGTVIRLGLLLYRALAAVSPPPCADGTPCDDGDPCTTNDRCQNGVCRGDPIGGTPCGPNMRAPIDQSDWPITHVADDPGGNYTAHEGFSTEGGMCYDQATKSWKYRIDKLFWKGKINITLKGSTAPDPRDGGNVTMENYCDIIAEMAGYLGRGRGDWHTEAASLAHEEHHRDFDWPNIVRPLWQAAEAAIEGECVPCTVPPAEARARLIRKRNEALAGLESGFIRDLRPFNAGHDSRRNDETYQAGQDELNRTIQKVKDYAKAKNWPDCPTRSVLRFSAQAAPKQLVDLAVTAGTDLLDAGQTTPLRVIGTFDDGSTIDLTGAARTTYQTVDPTILTVAPNGTATAQGPGVTTVLVSHSPGVDLLPLLASVSITVRFPDDLDNDGMPNDFETRHGLNPNDPGDARTDQDGDGLNNLEEFERGTDPSVRDSDGDGVPDREELIKGTDPLATAPVELLRQSGLHYFVIMDMEQRQVARRGVAGRQGIAHDSLILAPNRHYREWIIQASTLRVGMVDFTTLGQGRSLDIPAFILHEDPSADTDNDGLSDTAEFILGTDSEKPDTDGDGVLDGAEVQQGTNPLDNLLVSTGIIATADTPGNSVDVVALNDLAITANESDGITVFNVFSGLNPTVVAQVDTPGTARRVAVAGLYAAVADDVGGVAIVDISDPPAARIINQVNVGARALCVAAAGGFAYAGTSNGEVLLLEMASGTILARVTLGQPVQDLVFSGDYLFALTDRQLQVLEYLDGSLTRIGAAESPFVAGPNQRLFVGGGIACATHGKGYNTFDVSIPGQPRLIRAGNTSQFGWKQIVANGSGLGLAAVSPNQAFDGPHNVSLYDLTDPANTDRFLTEFETPGIARAVAIYNGLGYVADGPAGLQVVNYLPYDRNGLPPAIALHTSTAAGFAEEGKLLRITAEVRDDVQVRNVEFYLNDRLFAVDGGFPFEARFPVPPIENGVNRLTLRAKATDTGGNSTWTDLLALQVIPDATPPRVRRAVPYHGALAGAVRSVSAFFNEPIAQGSINDSTVRLVSAGPDESLGTADDLVVTGTLEYRDTLNAVFLLLPDRLTPGHYRLVLSPPLADLAGNTLAGTVISEFRVFSFIDDDHDGMPDELEAALGLNPAKPDTDGDGILDGLEDFDNDGLPNAGEVFAGTDPKNRDTDGDGIPDGAEDPDHDGLNNTKEFLAGTNPLVADTDRDGWNDETEVTGGSDPLNPASTPRLLFVGMPRLSANRISLNAPGAVPAGTFVARPPVVAHRISVTTAGAVSPGAFVARPPVVVGRFSQVSQEGPSQFILGRPPVEAKIGP